jgi:CRISPR-associated protein Cas1
VDWTNRTYDPNDWDSSDTVNKALSATNASLYGVVHSVIAALGCSPALGFIHTGHQLSFVYDIADLYKAELTIPLAFDIAAEEEFVDVGAEARRRIRDALHDGKLLERCSRDIHRLLFDGEPSEPAGDDGIDHGDVSIWDEYFGSVQGGVSYGDTS